MLLGNELIFSRVDEGELPNGRYAIAVCIDGDGEFNDRHYISPETCEKWPSNVDMDVLPKLSGVIMNC